VKVETVSRLAGLRLVVNFLMPGGVPPICDSEVHGLGVNEEIAVIPRKTAVAPIKALCLLATEAEKNDAHCFMKEIPNWLSIFDFNSIAK
jgi:hypothetical protein